MAVLSWKRTLAISMFIAILALLYLLSGKSVRTELVIEANPQQIWEVLMNEEGYKKWNGVLVPIKGEIEQGNKLTYKLVQPDGGSIEIGMTVAKLIPLKLLNQRGGIPGIFTYDHRYILEPVGNTTKVTIHEDFKGLVVLFWDTGWVQQAYTDLNESLRRHILN